MRGFRLIPGVVTLVGDDAHGFGAVGRGPFGMAVTPDGKTAFVTNAVTSPWARGRSGSLARPTANRLGHQQRQRHSFDDRREGRGPSAPMTSPLARSPAWSR